MRVITGKRESRGYLTKKGCQKGGRNSLSVAEMMKGDQNMREDRPTTMAVLRKERITLKERVQGYSDPEAMTRKLVHATLSIDFILGIFTKNFEQLSNWFFSHFRLVREKVCPNTIYKN